MIFLILFLIFFPMVFGTISFFVSKRFPKLREIFAISINLIEMISMIILIILFVINGNKELLIPSLCGMSLSFKADAFRIIYATVSIFLWLATITFSKDYMRHYINKDRYYFFYLLTLSGVVGVFFSNDLFTTFIFFELMSFASYPLVVHDEKEETMKAGGTYLAVAVVSGMILLMGMFMLYFKTGTYSFEGIKDYITLNGVTPFIFTSGILMLLGFGAKAGMYPLHIWLPKAHPVAPAPASALLSGILTKTGVYGIIVITSNIFFANASWGQTLLVFAVITMFFGAILALFSIDLKRTLACSSMSQIGFILVGIAMMTLLGEEGALAGQGALLHMINHSSIKLVLFMSAGLVAMNLHTLNLNDIKGFGRKKPLFMIVFLIGALGIMGIPGLNGYVSKTMIHESIVEYIHINELTGGQLIYFKIVEWIFLISGGLTIAYMTKLFVNLFIEKNSDDEKQLQFDNMKNYCSPLTTVVLIISSLIIPILGVVPNIINVPLSGAAMEFFNVEPLEHTIHFFSWESIKGALISLLIGAFIYGVIVRLLLIKNKEYLNLWPSFLDLEKGYIFIIRIVMTICLYLLKSFSIIIDGSIYLLRKTILKSHTYHYNKYPLSYKIGMLIDKLKPNKKNPHKYAEKYYGIALTVNDYFHDETSTFSFALGMVCFGFVLVLALTFVVILI